MTPLEFYRQTDYREIPGPASNPGLLAMIRRWIPWARDDSTTAWCAILRAEAARVTGTPMPRNPFRALSWLEIGEVVDLRDARPGDTVILDRGKGRGHVGLFVELGETLVLILGGNQRNRVCEGWYPRGDVIGVRRI